MATIIRRRVIAPQLIQEISRALGKLESVVIVGPMQSGKTSVARQVRKEIEGIAQILHFEYPARAGIGEENELLAGLVDPPPQYAGNTDLMAFFEAVRREARSSRRPIVLIVSHLDALSRDLACRFLQQIRAGVNDPEISVAALITAESHVFDLLLGPHSEFNCAYEYVLQGYDLPFFSAQLKRVAKEFDLRLDDDATLESSLWELTGGSGFLMRRCLLAWVEYRLSRGDKVGSHLDLKTLRTIADRLSTPGPSECPTFRHTLEIVEGHPEFLEDLNGLLREGRAEAAPEPPHAFELSGLAYYRGEHLVFSSRMLESFVKREFSAERQVYLYALAGNWETALQCYNRKRIASANATPSFHERVITHVIIRRLRETLRLSPRERADTLFRDALADIFGIDAVFRCRYDPQNGWVFEPPAQQSLRDAVALAMGQKSPEFFETGFFVGAVLDSVTHPREAIVILDGGTPLWLHREMRDLVKAYAESVREEKEKEAQRGLKKLQYALSVSVREILNDLYVSWSTPKDVLRRAISDLIDARPGMAQADFWLVSEDGRSLDCVAGTGADCFQPIPIEGSEDLATVIFNAGSEALEYPSREKFGATVSVPLCSRQGRNLGILSMAFTPGSPVSEPEVQALRVFAEQLGAAAAHSTWLLRIHRALDSMDEPIIVLDSCGNVAYSNRANEEMFKGELPAEFRQSIGKALAGQRIVEFPKSLQGVPYEGTAVFEPLRKSGHRGLVGVLIHVQHKSYYAHILNAALALERAASREEALESLLSVFSSLGHAWIRVYRIVSNQLAPDRCVDPGRPHIEGSSEEIVGGIGFGQPAK